MQNNSKSSMAVDLSIYKNFVASCKAQSQLLRENINRLTTQIENLKLSAQEHLAARDIVDAVGVASQQKATGIIEELTTKALQTVFDNTYGFKIVSKINRNQVEASMYVTVNGEQQTLKADVGGSVVDVVSFVLRVISWALDSKKLRNTLLLDEPARCVSKDIIPRFGEVMQYMSELLGIQFICISHDSELVQNCAHTIYKVEKENGISNVKIES